MSLYLLHKQCLRNNTGTSAFADISYLIVDVEAKCFAIDGFVCLSVSLSAR